LAISDNAETMSRRHRLRGSLQERFRALAPM
jgi:hypothetical protein